MKKLVLSGSELLAQSAIFIILGLTPIFFNYFYPANIDLYKIEIFKIGTLLLLFAIVWRFSQFKPVIDLRIWKLLRPLIFLIIFLAISLIFSVDPLTSWLGSYDRREGLVSWIFYGLWSTLLFLHLASYKEKAIKIRQLLILCVSTGFLISVYAILQLFGIDFLTWQEPAAVTGRAVSSLGQPNYLACWLLIVLPFSAYLFFTSKNKTSRFVWLSSFIIGLAALFATGSRAAFLVFLLVSAVWCFWMLIKEKKLSRRRSFMVIATTLALISAFAAFLALSNRSRFQEFSDIKKGSAYIRLELWQSGMKAFLKKPIFGYGLENQKEAYVSYYKSDWAIYARPNTYSDRAHNLILDTLLTNGIVGLAIFGYFLYWVYRNLWRSFKDKDNKLAAFLIWSLSAYLFSLLFNFSVTVTSIYFWFIVGLCLALSWTEPVLTDEKSKRVTSTILPIIAALLLLYGTVRGIRNLEADYYFNEALQTTAKHQYFTALVLYDYIRETHPDRISTIFYNQGLSLRFLESLPDIKDKSSLFAVLGYIEEVGRTMPESNFENKFVKAFNEGALGQRDRSERIFSDLSALSPELPKIYLAWGDVLSFNHDYQRAGLKFKKALNLLPERDNAYINAEQKVRLDLYYEQVQSRLERVRILE